MEIEGHLSEGPGRRLLARLLPGRQAGGHPPKPSPGSAAVRTLSLVGLYDTLQLSGALAASLVLLVACNLWRFSSSFIPLHDSLQIYQIFHFVYRNVFYSGTLPEWMPYNVYGMPIDFYRLVSLTPLDYVTIYIGAMLRIHDALMLFKVAMLLEESVFLVGMYLLGCALLRRKAAIWFLCMSAAFIPDYTYQAWWNFRIYYLVPLILYYLVCFFEGRGGQFLWIAGIVTVASMIGNLPYFAPIYLFVFFVVFVVYVMRNGFPWRSMINRAPVNLVALAIFIVFAIGYLYTVSHCLDEMVQLGVVGRDPVSHRVTLGQFLTYAGHPSLAQMVQMGIAGSPVYGRWTSHYDQSVYIGLIPVLLIPCSAATVRRAGYLAIGGAGALLLWLSVGGIFSRMVYFFPTMSLFRHIGALYPLIKVPLLVAAAYGLEAVLERGRSRHVVIGAVLLLVVADLATLVSDSPAPGFLGVRVGVYVAAAFVVVGLSLYQSRKYPGAERPRLVGLAQAVIIAQVIDMTLFTVSLCAACPTAPAAAVSIAGRVEPISYADQRTLSPASAPGRAREEIMNWARAHASEVYQTAYDWIGFAPARPAYFVPIIPERVQAFLNAMEQRSQSFDPATLQREYARIVGYRAPRVRLVEGTDFATAGDQMKWALEHAPAIDQKVVLPPSLTDGPRFLTGDGYAGDVQADQFSADSIEFGANVADPTGAWLVYADAYHADWRAQVDGAETEVRPAYGAFKAVHLPPGSHEVQFNFRRGRITIGGLTALMSIALTLAFVFQVSRLEVRRPP